MWVVLVSILSGFKGKKTVMQDTLGKGESEVPASLLETYHLTDKTDGGIVTKATEV